jgi:hypothetical protein
MKNPVIEKLLNDFKKSNKDRRQKLAEKNGYKTADEYKTYLEKNLDSKITVSKTAPKKKSKKVDNTPIDIVVAFDTTGSMSSYIASVRSHVKDLVKELFANTPNLRMKIVAFGDYVDMETSTEFGKAYQETSLTDNQDELIDFVKKAKNTAGGDGDEFYELVIKKTVEETPWRNGKRSVLLIGDANPHNVGYTLSPYVKNAQVDWKEEANKASKLNIQFDTLVINGYTWFKRLSEITNGVSAPFSNSKNASEVIRAATYSRGSASAFAASMDSAIKSGYKELIGMYKSMSSKLDE